MHMKSTIEAETAEDTVCLNCGLRFRGAFCSRCGQAASTRRLKLGEILGDAMSHLFNLDGKAAHTVRSLTRSPGRTCLDYVEGKRAGFVPPLRYFLVIIAASILVNLAIGFDPSTITANDSLTPKQAKVQTMLAGFAVRHLDLAMLFVLPIFVWVVKLLFRGSRFTYAEVGVLVLYVLGHAFLLGLLLAPLKWLVPVVAIVAKIWLQVGLFAWAGGEFFGVKPWISAVKSIQATAIYMMLVGFSVIVLNLPAIVAVIRGSS